MSLISLEEARKLLGEEGSKLPDNELQELIFNLETIARITIKDFVNKKSQDVNAKA